MKWCNLMNKWCSDMDNDDIENVDCDGECDGCCECEDVKQSIGVSFLLK